MIEFGIFIVGIFIEYALKTLGAIVALAFWIVKGFKKSD